MLESPLYLGTEVSRPAFDRSRRWERASDSVCPFVIGLVANHKMLVATDRARVVIRTEVPVGVELVGVSLLAADGAGLTSHFSP